MTHLFVFNLLVIVNSRLKIYTREYQKYQFLMFSYQQLPRYQSFGNRNTLKSRVNFNLFFTFSKLSFAVVNIYQISNLKTTHNFTIFSNLNSL